VDVLTERTPRVVSAVKLHRGAQRRKTGEFLVEGANSVEAALAGGHAVEIFCTVDAGARYPALLATAAAAGVRVSSVTDRAAQGLSDTVTPAGLVAVCRLLDVPTATALAGAPTLVAVPVEIAEPGNAGTVIRVADAVGADAVLLAGDSVDPHNGKCVRASAGSVFHLPIARERSIDAALSALAGSGLQVLATAADGEVDLDDAEELLRAPTAWLFGNEAHGLGPDVTVRADHRVRIPIRGRAESLNLATAAAICLYESARAHHRARA
jgi:TrmH family RNA methyltransferase